MQIRVENGGHFVPENDIKSRFHLGYKNLNQHFKYFDNLHLLNVSEYDSPPKHIVSLEKGKIIALTKFPKFLTNLLHDINKLSLV